MRRENVSMVTAGDVSATITSPAFQTENAQIASIQCVFTGSPAGTLKLQVSNDPWNPARPATNWDDLANSSVTISSPGIQTYNLTSLGFDQIRLVYTFTTGTGTLNARLVTKGF